ncbi:MAG: hypothetical protein ABIP63_08015 [Thermoanaerobaculia bacterium]
MRSPVILLMMMFAASAALASPPPLFNSPTESRWSVVSGGKTLGKLTVLTGTSGSRAEWKPSAGGATTVLLGGGGKAWLRVTGGDTEIASMSSNPIEFLAALPLLLPFSVTAAERFELKDGKPRSYEFRGAKASYQFDAKGPSDIDVSSGGTKYSIKRLSISASNADASNFTIRPRKGAASRLARLSGDLLGPSDSSVSATAGGRGVGTKGLKLKDGGDYEAVQKLEARDDGWRSKLDTALEEFQKDGKVGKSRGDQ